MTELILAHEPTPASGRTDVAESETVKVSLVRLFPTWVYSCETGPVHLNEGLEELTRTLRSDERNATRRTNVGGWHYAFDLFERPDAVVAEFRECMEEHVRAYLNHFRPEERRRSDPFRLRGWICLRTLQVTCLTP